MLWSADAVLARWFLWTRRMASQKPYSQYRVSPFKPSFFALFRDVSTQNKNRTSPSLSVCLWKILKRIQKNEWRLSLIICIYFSTCVSFLKMVPASFGRKTMFSSLQIKISFLFALQWGVEWKEDVKKKEQFITQLCRIFHWGALFDWQFQTVLDTAIFGRWDP